MTADVGETPWRLERQPNGRLDFLDAQGVRHCDVDVLRPFPLSDPAGPVAVMSHEGKELRWIETPAALPTDLRRIVEEAVEAREFLPVIETIRSIEGEDPSTWDVQTDHGPRQFTTANADAVERNRDGSLFITDTHGIRYSIPDRSRLDFRSRRFLDTTL